MQNSVYRRRKVGSLLDACVGWRGLGKPDLGQPGMGAKEWCLLGSARL